MTSEAGRRARAIRKVLWVTLGLNAAASAIKLIAGAASGSLSLVAGGLDSAFDGLANVAGLVAMRVVASPPDAEHPYGHRKFETLTAVGIAGLLLATCGRLAWDAAGRLAGFLGATGLPIPGGSTGVTAGADGHVGPEIGALALAAPLVSFALNFAASEYERRRGRTLGSELLVSDAGHTRADAGVSLSLFVGLIAVRAGYPIVDPLMALGIAAVVARVGLSIIRDTAGVLADAVALDPVALRTTAVAVPGVEGAHRIRSRGAPDAIAVDLHVQVDPHLGIGRAHAIGHAVQDALRARFSGIAEVVVHVEPEWALAGDEAGAAVRRALAAHPVEAHAIRVRDVADGRREVSLDLELEPTLNLRQAHALADVIEAAVIEAVPDVVRVVTHLEPRGGWVRPVRERPDAYAWRALVDRQVAEIAGLSEPYDVDAVIVGQRPCLSARVRADGGISLEEAHALAEELELRLRSAAPELDEVTIHVEPVSEGAA